MESINLDPAEEVLNARHLTALVERWLAAANGVAATKTAYSDKIRYFVEWWTVTGPAHDWQLTPTLAREYERYLTSIITARFGKPLAWQTRKSAILVVHLMFKWAATTGRTPKNYGYWFPWPEGETPKRRSATTEQLARLMLAAAESRYPARDQALLAFFIGTGCRLGEVANLKVDDLVMLADSSGTALVTGKRTRANRSGERPIAFDAHTGRYLIRYLNETLVTTGPLWQTNEGSAFSQMGIYRMVSRTVARAGLAETIRGCHDLRRAFATILTMLHPDSPAWADMIRRQLGHKSYSMTAHYVLSSADDIRDMLTGPLAGDC